MPKVTNPSHMPWHSSLIVRVIALCIVLVVCLLGSVFVLTFHYTGQIEREIEASSRRMVEKAQVYYEAHPDYLENPDRAEAELVDVLGGEIIDIGEADENTPGFRLARIYREDGYAYEAKRPLLIDDKFLELTIHYPIDTYSEVRRVFRNRYLLALSLIFIAALALMVYFIRSSLRPLRQLSKSCARISEGELEPIEVRKNSSEILALEQTFNQMVDSLRDKEVVEHNLRQAQRLSALGNLAAGVAHDVRNPLNAIKLLSGHAEDMVEENPAEARSRMATIREEVNRLEEIVAGFLSLAKEREIQPEPTVIDGVLEECVRLVKEDAGARDIRLTAELRAGDTALMLDSKQMTRALLNVMINALDATPEGGRVRLFSRVVDRECQIEVRDDGPGLEPEVAERVFDPYFTTKPTGTGLGLSITRGIIEEHGGTVELSSNVGQGTQVLISLPLPII